MGFDDEVILRQRVCRGSGCQAVFWICQHCDRGQCYCSPACRSQARLQQRRSANCRHQRSPEGTGWIIATGSARTGAAESRLA